MRRFLHPWLSWRAMNGEGPWAESRQEGDASRRARLAVALGATFLLAGIVGVVLATRGSDEPPAAPAGTCFVAWNEDPVAPRQDGIHAYTAHGYRQTLVTRIDREGKILEDSDDALEPDDPEARCAVIFASPQVDEEPDFGVRIFERNVRGKEPGWTGLALEDGTQLEDIARLQAEAVAISNAVLAADGTLAED
jgi:hypothetical protein